MIDILFVGAEHAPLRALCHALRAAQPDWQIRHVATDEMALEQLARRPVQVLLSCPDGSPAVATSLFDAAVTACPGAVRLAMLADPAANVPLAHQCLPTGSSPATVQAVLAGAVAVAERMRGNREVQRLLCDLREVASPPALYFDIREQLQGRDASLVTTAAIAARDPALVARVLKVANSGFYGLPRSVNDLTAALGLIGSDALLSLVLASHLFSGLPPPGMNLDRLWRHAQQVGALARAIAAADGGSRAQQNSAAMAGLLHDVGLIVLLQNEAARYQPLWRRAAGDEALLVELERGEFGICHGELGALILTLWTLPLDVVRAVAHSHLGDVTELPLVSRAVLAAEWLQGIDTGEVDPDALSPALAAAAPDAWQRWQTVRNELTAAQGG